MGKYFFYCSNDHCLSWFSGASGRLTVDKMARELDGKKLCRECYDAGFRLKLGVIVVRAKAK